MDSTFENDRETGGLTVEELSELVIGYAQENERLRQEAENLKSALRDARATEAAIRRFVTDPAIAAYIPSADDVIAHLFGDPLPLDSPIRMDTPEKFRAWAADAYKEFRGGVKHGST